MVSISFTWQVIIVCKVQIIRTWTVASSYSSPNQQTRWMLYFLIGSVRCISSSFQIMITGSSIFLSPINDSWCSSRTPSSAPFCSYIYWKRFYLVRRHFTTWMSMRSERPEQHEAFLKCCYPGAVVEVLNWMTANVSTGGIDTISFCHILVVDTQQHVGDRILAFYCLPVSVWFPYMSSGPFWFCTTGRNCGRSAPLLPYSGGFHWPHDGVYSEWPVGHLPGIAR